MLKIPHHMALPVEYGENMPLGPAIRRPAKPSMNGRAGELNAFRFKKHDIVETAPGKLHVVEEADCRQAKLKPLHKCETCQDTGETLVAKLYPTGHAEEMGKCPDCEGPGTKPTPAVMKFKVGDLCRAVGGPFWISEWQSFIIEGTAHFKRLDIKGYNIKWISDGRRGVIEEKYCELLPAKPVDNRKAAMEALSIGRVWSCKTTPAKVKLRQPLVNQDCWQVLILNTSTPDHSSLIGALTTLDSMTLLSNWTPE